MRFRATMAAKTSQNTFNRSVTFMLKFSICLLILVSNFTIAQAQGAADYSESPNPVAREYKVEKKSKKEAATVAAVSNSVSVPVTVVDQKGTFINNLTAADFKVFVDDVEVKPTSFQRLTISR